MRMHAPLMRLAHAGVKHFCHMLKLIKTSVQKKSFNILHSPHPPPNSGSGVGVLLLLYDPVLTIEISVSDVCGR